jgi:hypothetical protein
MCKPCMLAASTGFASELAAVAKCKVQISICTMRLLDWVCSSSALYFTMEGLKIHVHILKVLKRCGSVMLHFCHCSISEEFLCAI